jgi:hypothetical protein
VDAAHASQGSPLPGLWHTPLTIFISHASKDDEFVKQLRLALEGQGLTVWVDSRNLRGGHKLAPETEKAIEEARQIIVVLSPNTVNSPWVRKEIAKALEVEQQRKDEGYRVIPLLFARHRAVGVASVV